MRYKVALLFAAPGQNFLHKANRLYRVQVPDNRAAVVICAEDPAAPVDGMCIHAPGSIDIALGLLQKADIWYIELHPDGGATFYDLHGRAASVEEE